MAKEEQEVSTAEIAQALKAGYRQFKLYEKGLDMARAVLELEGRTGQLTAAKHSAEEEARVAGVALKEVQDDLTELEGKREAILTAITADTERLVGERREKITALHADITRLEDRRQGAQEVLQDGLRDVARELAQQRATGEELIRRDIAILQGQKTALEAQVKALNEQAEAFEKGVAGVRKVRSS